MTSTEEIIQELVDDIEQCNTPNEIIEALVNNPHPIQDKYGNFTINKKIDIKPIHALFIKKTYKNVASLIISLIRHKKCMDVPAVKLWIQHESRYNNNDIATLVYERIKATIEPPNIITQVYAIQRYDIQDFVAKATAAIITRFKYYKKIDEWIIKAITGNWKAPLESQFQKDIVRGIQKLEIQTAEIEINKKTELNFTISVYGSAGIGLTPRDKTLLLLWLMFSEETNYLDKCGLFLRNNYWYVDNKVIDTIKEFRIESLRND